MDRRSFLHSTVSSSLFGAYGRSALSMVRAASKISRARPSVDQIAWAEMEVGMFVHFAPNTWQDVEQDNLSTPLSGINPERLDTDQWARTAVQLGAKYLVFVAKHSGGFCMWQTRTTEYGIRNTPWKGGRGDVLAEVAASCRRHGLKLGVYVSPRDEHLGAKTGGICATPELQRRYDAIYRQQLTEVLRDYGPMVELWFDGSTRTPVDDLIRQYQPNVMVFQGPSATIRWVGNEDGYAPYPCWNGIDAAEAKTGTATALNSDPEGSVWMPSEVDVSIRRPDWFWSTKNESKVLRVDQMLSVYYRSVGRGAQLLLNIPANRDGLLPDADCAIARQFGTEVRRRFDVPLAQTAGGGSVLELPLEGSTSGRAAVDTIVLQEDIRLGERVRGYRLEGRLNGSWVPLGEGSAIGHKRIQPVAPGQYGAIRLTVLASAGRPAIRTLAAFATGQSPPPDWAAPTTVWAANLVGEWQDHVFRLDLSSQIKAATQFRLRFVPFEGAVQRISGLTLRLDGVKEPALIKPSANRPNVIVLDITGIGGVILLEGRVEGAARGSITLQQL